jgi:capsular polysaccharide biosynthesis protein
MASAHGYTMIRPETLSLAEQVAVFSDGSVVIGEHGIPDAQRGVLSSADSRRLHRLLERDSS